LAAKLEKTIKEVDKEKAVNSVDYLINLPELSKKIVNDIPNSHLREKEILETFLSRHMLYF
jgi:hypothetical protein